MRLCLRPVQRATRGSPKTLPASRAARHQTGLRARMRLPRMGPAPGLCSDPPRHVQPLCPALPTLPRLTCAGPPAQCPAKAASCSAPWCPIHAPLPPDQTKTPEAWALTPVLLITVHVTRGRSLPSLSSPGMRGGYQGGAEFSVHKITSAGPVESARHMESAGKMVKPD